MGIFTKKKPCWLHIESHAELLSANAHGGELVVDESFALMLIGIST